jgi:hypothetical protein
MLERFEHEILSLLEVKIPAFPEDPQDCELTDTSMGLCAIE